MKIGILLISSEFSGAENAVHNIIKSMLNFDLNISFFTNDEMIKYYTDIKELNLFNLGKLKSKNYLSPFKDHYLFYKKLRKYLCSYNIDIILLFLEGSFIVYSPLYKNNIPTILMLRGGEVQDYQNKRKLIHRYAFKKALDRCKLIASVNSSQIKPLEKRYKYKTIIIPNGINYDFYKPLKKYKRSKKTILFVGRYIWEKGIKEIITAAKQLPQYEFWFVGEGPLENIIKGKNIKNLGFKNSEKLVELYNKATICILPSYHEGFSNVGLEALSCGKAFIGTPDFSEYIENGKDGIIIPAKDETSLKNAIVDLMTNEKKRKMLEKNAREKALQYSWDKVAKQYLKVFKKVLKGNKK